MEPGKQLVGPYKWPLLLFLVGIVLVATGSFSTELLSPRASSARTGSVAASPATIQVDINGAVNLPGVKLIRSNSRVDEVIKMAGGLSASASGEYVSKILNLSRKVSDGEKIYIPYEGEAVFLGVDLASKVGINSAPESRLNDLPGVTSSSVQKIIRNRPYRTLYDLVVKKSVSKAVYDKIQDLIDLN